VFNKYEFKILMDTCISHHGTLTNTGPVTFQIICFYRLLVTLNYDSDVYWTMHHCDN